MKQLLGRDAAIALSRRSKLPDVLTLAGQQAKTPQNPALG